MNKIENQNISKDFLLTTEALSRTTGLQIIYAPNRILCEATEVADATCEVDAGDEAESSKISFSKQNVVKGKYDDLIQARAPIDPKTLPETPYAAENNPLKWPKTAMLRFLHILTHDRPDSELTYLYLSMVSNKMKYVSSNEPFNSESYIHPQDLKKYRVWKNNERGEKSVELQIFRTNFEVDVSIPKLNQMIWYFFKKDQMDVDMDKGQVGGYKDVEKPAAAGSRKSTRQRKSLPRV